MYNQKGTTGGIHSKTSLIHGSYIANSSIIINIIVNQRNESFDGIGSSGGLEIDRLPLQIKERFRGNVGPQYFTTTPELDDPFTDTS
jgi:hypothetical protein